MTATQFEFALGNISPTLRPFAIRWTKNVEDANDLLQETLFKAFSNKDKFKEGTNLKAWLYTIMKNTFITQYQKLVKRKTFVDTTDNLHYINSSDRTIQNKALSNFVMADIDQALRGLDATYKDPFLMYFEGFKYHEIAVRLDVPIGTVKNRIHIARKILKKALSQYKFVN